MKVINEAGNLRVGLNNCIGKFNRMRGGVTDSLYPGDSMDQMKQVGKVDDIAKVICTPVGIHVLPEQVDFFNALIR